MVSLNANDQPGQHVLASVLDVLSDGVVIFDCAFNLAWTNQWMNEKYADRMPLVGKKCYSVFGDGSEPAPIAPTRRALKPEPATPSSGPIHPSKIRNRGSPCLSLVSRQRLDLGAVGHVRDITEHRRAEEMLRDEISRRRILVDQSRDGIVVLDVEGKVVESNLGSPACLDTPWTRCLRCPCGTGRRWQQRKWYRAWSPRWTHGRSLRDPAPPQRRHVL